MSIWDGRETVLPLCSLSTDKMRILSAQSSMFESLFELTAKKLSKLTIMSAMASQITSLTIVYSIVHSGADQRKHQNSSSSVFVRGIHRWQVNSPHKKPVTRKNFHLMTSSWYDPSGTDKDTYSAVDPGTATLKPANLLSTVPIPYDMPRSCGL